MTSYSYVIRGPTLTASRGTQVAFSVFGGFMARGDKSAYTDKQKRKAEHIEESYEERGVPENEAERRAWATVNAMDHGGKKSGSGRGKRVNKAPGRKTSGRKTSGRKTSGRKTSGRKTSGRKASGRKTSGRKTSRR